MMLNVGHLVLSLTLASSVTAVPLKFSLPKINLPSIFGFGGKSEPAPTKVSAAEIASFSPWAFFASAAYCNPAKTKTWTCGFNCDSSPGFKPVASGGDGAVVQFWYVGFDPRATSVIVAHQGTDFSKIEAALTDFNFFLDDLNPTLFPGVPRDAKVHNGFGNSQEKSARDVLAAVKTTISQFNATRVTVVGHSLGGALAMIDAVFLRQNLPDSMPVFVNTFGQPRVGNQQFIDFIDKRLAGRVARVTNREDITPTVPLLPMGFHQPKGERHIQPDGSWFFCPGNDNKDPKCSTGEIKNIFDGGPGHAGPYDGTGVTRMGC